MVAFIQQPIISRSTAQKCFLTLLTPIIHPKRWKHGILVPDLVNLLLRKFLENAHFPETSGEALCGYRAAAVFVEVLEGFLHRDSHLGEEIESGTCF